MKILLICLCLFAAALRAGPYSPPAGDLGSIAMIHNDPSVTAWATGYSAFSQGPGVAAANPDTGDTYAPENTLGQADAHLNTHNVLPLGDGGSITLTFAQPITNGSGWDFVVFENAVTETFLELAFVDVSSDGQNFTRFASVSLTPLPVVGINGVVDTTNVHNLGGKFISGYATPFNLEELAGTPGLNINAVTHVRIIDVIGDGSTFDSLGNPVYDPYPTSGTSGFDLDAIGVIHSIPEPAQLLLVLVGGCVLLRRSRKG